MNPLLLPAGYLFVFGILVQIGGVVGFVKAGSKASLIAGLVSGLLLELAAVLTMKMPDRPQIGLWLGVVVIFLLLGRFAPIFFKTKKFMPAGMIFFLGLVGLSLSMGALFKF